MINYCYSLNKVNLLIALLLMIIACSSCEVFSDWISIGVDAKDVEEGTSTDGAIIDSHGRLSITRFGINWLIEKEDKKYVYDKFANGDYWVVGPVTVVSITPKSRVISGRTKNGAMLNPSPSLGNKQGYDSSCYAMTYLPNLNVALNVSSSNPLILQNGSSLVSTISISPAGNVPQLQTAAILTVLATPPPLGSFRPPYSGTDKTIKYNVSQLNYGLLKKLNPVAETPSLSTVERYFERPWIDHAPGWGGRFIHPRENMPDYGRDISSQIGICSLILHLDFTDQQKEILLVRFVQLGIDLYGIIQAGGIMNWAPDGGHTSGRKWPILFAGLMLNDQDMLNIGEKSGKYLYENGHGPGNIPPDYIHFGEDGSTFYVTSADLDINHYYTPESRDYPEYTPSDLNMAEWGIRHSTNPTFDGNTWNASYRTGTAIAWSGFILAARIMEAETHAKTLWNHDALFDYQDRYMAMTAETSSNPAWRTFINDDIWGNNPGQRTVSKFVENMWDSYRHLY